MDASIEREVGGKSAAGGPEGRGVRRPGGSDGSCHPTARADGRSPTTRAADTALAAAMNAPLEALELLADAKERSALYLLLRRK